MNIIGLNVNYIDYTRAILSGVVIDKYIGTKKITTHQPNGVGGFQTVDDEINAEYYLIQTNDGLRHVLCSEVTSINTPTEEIKIY